MPRDSECPVSLGFERSATSGFLQRPLDRPLVDDGPEYPCQLLSRASIDDAIVVIGDDPVLRQGAATLVKRQYESRGYQVVSTARPAGQNIELASISLQSGAVNGTLSVAMDGPHGLMAERTYRAEIIKCRTAGARIAEGTRFAVDATANPFLLLPALFYMAFTWAHGLMGATDMVIEVTPRHATFYRQMLGFRAIGEPRLNRTVSRECSSGRAQAMRARTR
jgi:hypothetical protein